MSVTTCDHNLGFLIMVLQEPDFCPLKNGNIFVPPTDLGSSPINDVVTDAKVTEFIHLYKENISLHYHSFVSTLKRCITKTIQFEPLALQIHLYTEYGTITSSGIAANFNCMTACWNPTTPIDNLFKEVSDIKYFTLVEKYNQQQSNPLTLLQQCACICTCQCNTQNLAQKKLTKHTQTLYH